MAKILMTAIVADIRNKLNGSVFSKNRYGAYVRTKVTPVNPQTTSQQNARNILSTNAQAWRGLTEAERQGWVSAGASFPFTDIFGNSKQLSGSALYSKLNNNLLHAGEAPISAAPSPVAIPDLGGITITAAEAVPALSMVMATTPVPAGFSLMVFATPNIGAGRSFVKNQFRFISAVAAAAASPVNLLAAYQAVFGNPVAGQKIFVKAFYVSTVTGQAGIPAQAMAIVAA
jgi:hypothetical protein